MVIRKKSKKEFPFCPKCNNKERRMYIGEVWGTYLVLRCSLCGFEKRDEGSLESHMKDLKKPQKMEDKELD